MITTSQLTAYIPEINKRHRYALYLAVYLLLSLLSAEYETSSGSSSHWYLPNGLLFAMFFIEGRPSLLLGLVAGIAAGWALHPQAFDHWTILEALSPVLVYSAVAVAMRNQGRIDRRLSRLRDSSTFLAVIGPAVLAVALLNSIILLLSGSISSNDFVVQLLYRAVGDALGILTLTPSLLIGHQELAAKGRWVIRELKRPNRTLRQTVQALLPVLRLVSQMAGIALVLWIVFGWSASRDANPFYLCFLPLIWIGLSNGIEGTARGIAAVNIGTMAAMIITGQRMNDLPIFMLIFSTTSLILGSVISESKKNEAILRGSEQTLRSVYDNVYDAIVVHESDGKIIDANDKLLSLLRTGRNEIIGRTVLDVFQPSTILPASLAARWSLAIAGQPQLFEWKMVLPEGRQKDMEVYLSRVQMADRWVALSTIRDITNHKESQRRQVALRRISEAASTAETLQQLFVTFHEAIGSLIPTDNFYICLYDQQNERLTFPYFVDKYDRNPEVLEPKRGLTEYVLRTGKPILVTPEDFDLMVAAGEVESIGSPSIDWLGVPLKVQDVTIGVMAVQSYTDEVRFDEEYLNFLVLVSPHVAMAIEHRRTEDTLKQQHDFIRTIYDSSPDAILTIDLKSRITDCNPATLSLLGCEAKEEIIGHNAYQFIRAEDRWHVERQLASLLRAGVAKHIEFQLASRHDTPVDVEMSVSLICDEQDVPSFFIGHLIDITQRKQAENALRVSEERYSLATLGANDGLWDWDLLRDEVYYSPRWISMLGMDNELSNSPEFWFSRVHHEDLPFLKDAISAHLSGRTPQLECEYRIRHEDGVYRWMLVRGIGISRAGGTPHRLAGSQTDITSRKSTEQRLIHDALHDALTALPNRALFLDRLGQSLKRCGRHPEASFAVLFLDLDRFKVINDSLGHHVGDEILISVARRLENCLREQDTVARLSGDEFAILMEDLQGPADAVQVASRVQAEIARPHKINEQAIFTTVSIGIAFSDACYQSPEEILRDADTAMYQAKGSGGSRYMVFNKTMHTAAVRLLELETDLRQALQTNQFALSYQPIISLASGKVIGAEALLRWEHPTRGLRLPGDFLPLAEETGLIVPIGEWALRTACQQLKEWHLEGLDDLSIAVNISDRQFQHQDLPAVIRGILAEVGLQPRSLMVEINENINLMHSETIEDMLFRLKTLGVSIAMDDFGTGYASLNTLKRLAIDCVKIDRTFIGSIKHNHQNDLIIASIIQMANKLGFMVIAEGVETRQQLAFLKECGCDLVQGYLYSTPLSPADFADHARRQVFSWLSSPDHSLYPAAD